MLVEVTGQLPGDKRNAEFNNNIYDVKHQMNN